MRATKFKEVNYSLSKLIEDIDTGEIGLPDIQRPFVWERTRVRDLFDSMYHGFPIGYLLFWANGAAPGARQIGVAKHQSAPRLLIVDGQQRLTSLYSVLKGVPVVDANYKESLIRIAFRPRDAAFRVADATTNRDPEYISNISDLWVGELPRNRFVRAFIEKLRESREVSDDEEDHLIEEIDRLYDLQSYPFTALELSQNVDEEQVAEVFVRINSQAVQLNQADFILTLMSVFWDEGRKQLETFCRSARAPTPRQSSAYNHFIEPDPDQLLRVAVGLGFRRGVLRAVYSVLRGKDVETEHFSDELRVQQFARLQEAQSKVLDLNNWHQYFQALVRAGYRHGRMITSEMNILYCYVLFLIGKYAFEVEPHLLRETIARWFFMTALTGRYSASPESQIEGDLAQLRPIETAEQFVDLLTGIVDDTLTNDFWEITLPNDLASSAARSPSLYAYYAALNILDANVLFSKMRVRDLFDPSITPPRSPLERHHLFPKGHLAAIGIEATRDQNQIANFALLEWPDNNKISDQAPSSYFPDFFARLNEREKEQARFWHALPNEWEEMQYADFLEARRGMLANIVREGFIRLRHGDPNPGDEDGANILSQTAPDLIEAGESASIEFKSSARVDANGDRQEFLEEAVVKSVAGFLNADGGVLLIGVNDQGTPLGLERDFGTLRKTDRDGYELWLHDLFEAWLGKPALPCVSVIFETIEEADVCRVTVKPSNHPVYANKPKTPKTDVFYVRTGNSTRKLTTDEAVTYIKGRWT